MHPRDIIWHYPSSQVEELAKKGVDKVLCVTPSTPDALEELRAREDLKSPKVDARLSYCPRAQEEGHRGGIRRPAGDH